MAVHSVQSAGMQLGVLLKGKRKAQAQPQADAPLTSVSTGDSLELPSRRKQRTIEPDDKQVLLDMVYNHPSESSRCLAALVLGETGDFEMVSPLTHVIHDEQAPVSVRNSAFEARQKLWKSWAIKPHVGALGDGAAGARPASPFLIFDDIVGPDTEQAFLLNR